MQYAAHCAGGVSPNKSPELKSASGNPGAEGACTNPKPRFPSYKVRLGVGVTQIVF
jgi:hypothetical protein